MQARRHLGRIQLLQRYHQVLPEGLLFLESGSCAITQMMTALRDYGAPAGKHSDRPNHALGDLHCPRLAV